MSEFDMGIFVEQGGKNKMDTVTMTKQSNNGGANVFVK